MMIITIIYFSPFKKHSQEITTFNNLNCLRLCLRTCLRNCFFSQTISKNLQVESLSPHLCNPFAQLTFGCPKLAIETQKYKYNAVIKYGR